MFCGPRGQGQSLTLPPPLPSSHSHRIAHPLKHLLATPQPKPSQPLFPSLPPPPLSHSLQLEQVRAQERSKNEEKANIHQLHQTQGGVPDATVVVTVDAADATAASALANGLEGEGACVDASAPGRVSVDKNNSSSAGGRNMITVPLEGGGVAATGREGVENSGHQGGGVGVENGASVCSVEELEGMRGRAREGGDVVAAAAAVLVVKPQLEKREGNESPSRVTEESAPPGRQETR